MATPEVTANAQQTLPTAAVGVSVTPNATAWVNSAYTQLTASIGANITIIGVVVNPGITGAEFEVDIATGAATSEVVVATFIGTAASTIKVCNYDVICHIPIDNIASGSRIAVRMRKLGTSVTAWTFKLVYYNQVSSTMGVTTNASLCVPSAAAGVSLTPSGSAWVNSAYGQLSASLTDVVALGFGIFETVISAASSFELDLAIGAATSEVVVGTTGGMNEDAAVSGMGFVHLVEFRIPISLPGTNRVACRLRKSSTAVNAWTVKLLYVSASGFGVSAMQYTTQPQKITPDAAALGTVAGSMTAWANSAYLQLIASTSLAQIVVGRMCDTAANFEWENEIATGAATSEVVVSAFGDQRNGSHGSNCVIANYLPLDNVAASVRTAMRHRDSDSTANTQGLGYTYYEKPL